MPLISIREENGSPNSNKELEAGTYHTTSIALSASLQQNSLEVGIGEFKIMKPTENKVIWTKSLQSCFPALFLYTDGSIALFHGLSAALNPVNNLLKKPGLKEIILIYKKNNLHKIAGISEQLFLHFQNRESAPKIRIQENIKEYKMAVCYRNPSDNQPVFLVGVSGDGKVASDLGECLNQTDAVTPYILKDAFERFYPGSKELECLRREQSIALEGYAQQRLFNQAPPNTKESRRSHQCVLL